MRLGFVHGVEGNPVWRTLARSRLASCDAIVSLGNWVGREVADQEPLDEDGRLILLEGENERRLARARTTPEPLRRRLGGLPTHSVVEGVAVVGGVGAGSSDGQHLVAPLAVYAHRTETRLWRASHGLARVESIRGPRKRILGDERIRLDLGLGGKGEGPSLAILDLGASTLEVLPSGKLADPAPRRRSRPPMPTQIALAM